MKLILGFVIGLLVGKYWHGKHDIENINTARHKAKEESLAKIMAMFDRQEEITNNHVERSLNVSDATATNYLKELEGQGKVVQIGAEGRGVAYRKK